jgi:hypothetical protein
VTSLVMTTSSSAHLSAACLRFTSCFMAVRKPCRAHVSSSQVFLRQETNTHAGQMVTEAAVLVSLITTITAAASIANIACVCLTLYLAAQHHGRTSSISTLMHRTKS